MLPEECSLLRIFIGESDRRDGQPLYEWIVLLARARGLAGATVLRGVMGFGASSRIQTFKVTAHARRTAANHRAPLAKPAKAGCSIANRRRQGPGRTGTGPGDSIVH